jgi:hypothetical protein
MHLALFALEAALKTQGKSLDDKGPDAEPIVSASSSLMPPRGA